METSMENVHETEREDTERNETEREDTVDMSVPVTREELAEVLRELMAELVEPLVDGHTAYLMDMMHSMMVQSGLLTEEKFCDTFQMILNKFTAQCEMEQSAE